MTLLMVRPTTPTGRRGGLSAREYEVLDLVTRPGGSQRVAAQALGISPFTVRNHLTSIYRKLQVYSAAQAVRALTEVK